MKLKIIQVTSIILCLLSVSASILLGNQIYIEGVNQETLSDYTNLLIKRAAYVDIVQEGLKQYFPNAPSNSSIVLGNIDIWSFNKNSGPQFWYDDSTINVYELNDLRFENGQPYIENPVENQVQAFTGSSKKQIFLDSSKLFVFDVSNGKLIKVDLK